jgi:hypothetical protein
MTSGVFLNELILFANYARWTWGVPQAVFSVPIDSGAFWSVWRGVEGRGDLHFDTREVVVAGSDPVKTHVG